MSFDTAGPSAARTATSPRTRLILLAALALPLAGLATLAAHALHTLIALITQLAFYGRFSTAWVSPEAHTRGAWVILIPAVGGGLIALMARYGSKGIIGHGIPEVMQQVLANRSRIGPRVALLKPVSSAISIGTGGPYGAEGPVIATGGALGSLIGQALTMTASERKVLLAAGAAAAMTAIFGSPVAATLLAVELLLFEFRARSVIPVAIAAACAQALRFVWGEHAALFHLAVPDNLHAPASAVVVFAIIGMVAGVLAVATNHAVHKVEAGFARLPIHWMWCPVIGGFFVGLVGWFEPRVFGAGYSVIGSLLEGNFPLAVVGLVCGLKLLVWIVSLGSGTSGGTLAPMLVAGGGLGTLVAAACAGLPMATISPGLAALAGMVAFFAGGSRAFFASIVLGVEITQQAGVLWPVATAATASLAVAHLLSSRSLMSSPVEQRGVRVPMDFDTDVFAHVTVEQVMETTPHTISTRMKVSELADRVGAHDPEVCHHTALLVTDDTGELAGIITRRDLLNAVAQGAAQEEVGNVMTTPVLCAYPDESLHEAVERMQLHDIGRLPVVERDNPKKLIGYLGRAAALSARRSRWSENHEQEAGWFSRRLRS
ncbi:chloride channel protein [Rariglobus hedericola]|uniref:Chloride channel protein n=1 Tax=Rariglobus hedericola TaxID=2597822 RepID=A0A556QS94_9BACT|nr:chloride channel protein [Rariglobus hedericola]TSJ79516.1 chloride channel protein [Rariglobus hedericola]